MADEMSKTEVPKRQARQAGPMGRRGPGRVVEKPKDFKGTMLKRLS